MEADRWLGLDLRHLVALKTIADEGSFGQRRREARLHAVGDLAADRDARADRRPPPDRAARWPSPHLADRGRTDPSPARGGDPGTAARGEGRHGGARGRRRRTPPRRHVPERRRQDHPALLRRFSETHPRSRSCSASPRTRGAPRDGRARRARPDVLDAAVDAGPYETVELLTIRTCSSSRRARRSPRSKRPPTLKEIVAPAARRLQPLQRDEPRRVAARLDRTRAERRVPLRQQRDRPGSRRRRCRRRASRPF